MPCHFLPSLRCSQFCLIHRSFDYAFFPSWWPYHYSSCFSHRARSVLSICIHRRRMATRISPFAARCIIIELRIRRTASYSEHRDNSIEASQPCNLVDSCFFFLEIFSVLVTARDQIACDPGSERKRARQHVSAVIFTTTRIRHIVFLHIPPTHHVSWTITHI